MNETIYSICTTKVLGTLAYLLGLCAFPPPVAGVLIQHIHSTSPKRIDFTIPVEGIYTIELALKREPSVKGISEHAGEKKSAYCLKKLDASDEKAREEFGSTPLHVILKNSDGKVLEDFHATGNCSSSWWQGDTIGRPIAELMLKKGNYTLLVNSDDVSRNKKFTESHLSIQPPNLK